MKLFLTSAGFDNRKLVNEFFKLTDRQGSRLRTLFIPTALNTPEMKQAIPVFMEDLYCLGIVDENITQYDLEKPFVGSIEDYDVILFTAGNPDFLMKRINEVGFREEIGKFLATGGIYIGISAGSDIAGNNIKEGLNLIDANIECHCDEGNPAGVVDLRNSNLIKLSDMQALVIDENDIQIKE